MSRHRRLPAAMLALAMLAAAGCDLGIFELNNPVDPEAQSYTGQPSVDGDGDGLGQYADVDEITLSSPANGSTLRTLVPTLAVRLLDPTRVGRYWVQVATESTFAAPVLSIDTYTSESCAIPSGELANHQTYYWRAKAYDDITGSWSSRWSPVWSFTISIIVTTPHDPSPGSGDATNDSTPLLQWAQIDGIAGYDIQVSPSSGFGSLLVDETVTDSQYAIDTALSNKGTYYWRVRARDSEGAESQWSGPWSLDVLIPVPTSPSPSGGATTSDTTPLLSWQSVSVAASYPIQLGTSDGFEAGTVLVDTDAGSGASYQVAAVDALSDGQTYYWRARTKDSSGVLSDWSGATSGAWSFTIDLSSQVPGIPSPSGGSTTSDTTPRLDWEDITGAQHYHVQLSTASDCLSGLILDTSSLSDSYADVSTHLDHDGTYYWRVATQNADLSWTDWSRSTIWHFHVDLSSLVPTVPDPSSGSSTTDSTPLLGWEDITGASYYRVQLSTDSSFVSDPIVDDDQLSASGKEVDTVLDPSTYYWRVCTQNSDGVWSPWSSPWRLDIDLSSLVPVDPNLFGGVDTLDTTPLLDWEDTGATHYQVQLSTDSTFETDVLADDQSLEVSEKTVSYVLSDGETYFWRVRGANDDAVWSSWSSPPWSFVVDLSYLVPTTPDPGDTDTIDDTTPVLDWEDTGATYYDVQLSTDPDCGSDYVLEDSSLTVSEVGVSTLSPLDDLTTYYWRVRGQNIDGAPSRWSGIWSFRVELPTPAVPWPSGDGEDLYDFTPLMNWSDVAVATSYDLQLSKDSAFTPVDLDVSTLTSSQYEVQTALDDNTTYYWHVRIEDANGVKSGWSATWHFTTAPLGVLQPTVSVEIPAETDATFSGETTVTQPQDLVVTVTGSDVTAYAWMLDGSMTLDVDSSVTLDSEYLTPGLHWLMAMLTQGGQQYSKTLQITVLSP